MVDAHTLLTVNEDRLVSDLEELGRFGRNEQGGVDRESFSQTDQEARRWLISRCQEAGLEVRTDSIGNMVISSPVLEAAAPDKAPVWSGSHIDAVPNGGIFDGPLGSLAAVECLRRLHETQTPLARPVQAVVFSDEEGSYASLLGSTALTHGFTTEQLSDLSSRYGQPLAEALPAAGGDLAGAAELKLAPGSVHASVELHIEQGPVLEETGTQIGVVTAIVTMGGGTVRFTGKADHAGTTPLDRRQDASLAAAQFILALPQKVRAISPDAVATTGIIRVEPSSANVVPESVEIVVDFRDPSREKAEQLKTAVLEAAQAAADEHSVRFTDGLKPLVDGAVMDSGIRQVIAEVAAGHVFSTMDIPSGAGHDSQNMAAIAPTGMIFVPSTGGHSHSPAEHTPWPDVIRGANTLLGTLTALAKE